MIQDVLMDRYEEVVLVDLSPNKLYRSEGGDGWLIHRCNHEAAALSPCYISENKNKTQTNLGGEKKGFWTSIIMWTRCVLWLATES